MPFQTGVKGASAALTDDSIELRLSGAMIGVICLAAVGIGESFFWEWTDVCTTYVTVQNWITQHLIATTSIYSNDLLFKLCCYE